MPTFDENGLTVSDETTAPEVVAAAAEAPEVEEAAEATEPESGGRTYRIGDKTFANQAEALAYAESHVTALETEQQVADAYRQGIRDAASERPSAETVTPQADDLNTEELYTDPANFLDRFAKKIKTETQAELLQREATRNESEQIWREFTDRHPELADFREDVESFVERQQTEVRAVIKTKGRPAAYDYVATKLKSRFENYATALKPKRALANGSAGASPSGKPSSVTPKETPKKALSFNEQIRSIRKRHQS